MENIVLHIDSVERAYFQARSEIERRVVQAQAICRVVALAPEADTRSTESALSAACELMEEALKIGRELQASLSRKRASNA